MVFWTDIYYVFKREFYAVFRDHAVLTFFVALILGYPVVYTFIYSNEVAREVPVAVVDHSKSTLSREVIRNWDATASQRRSRRGGFRRGYGGGEVADV